MKRFLFAIAATVLLSFGVSNAALADCSVAPVTSTSDMGISFLAANGTQVGPTTELLSSVKEGVLVYDSSAKKMKICDGTNWIIVGSGSGGATVIPVLIPQASGTIITDGTQTTAAAFDGNNNQLGVNSAAKLSTTSWYIGKNYGASSYPVYQAKVWGGSNSGYSSANINVTMNLRGNNTAPSNAADGVLLGTTTFADTSTTDPRIIASSDNTTAYKYIWVETIGASSSDLIMAEVEFYAANPVVSSQWITNGNDIYYNTGNVGVGMTDPSSGAGYSSSMRVLAVGGTGIAAVASTGVLSLANNSPTASGIDVLGVLDFVSTNAAVTGVGKVGARVWSRAEGTGGANGYGASLIFHTKGDNAVSYAERMRITSAGNIGIGTNAPAASALLDLTSTTRGLLPPRMTTAQRTAIATPATGLLVYDTDINSFYFYNGTAWTVVGSGAGSGSGGSSTTTSNETWDSATAPANGTLSAGNLKWAATNYGTTNYKKVFGTQPTGTSGKFYYEVVVGTQAGGGNQVSPGFDLTTNAPGQSASLAMTVSTGATYNVYSGTAANGDVIMLAADVAAGKFWYGKNGTWAAGGNPAAGTGANGTFTASSSLYPALATVISADNANASFGTARFSAGAWSYAAPSGFGMINPGSSGGGATQWTDVSGGINYAGGNVAVGNPTPAASSILDLTSTTKGFLPPRMTSTQRDAITSPATGLTIYNTTTSSIESYNGTAWLSLGSLAIAGTYTATLPPSQAVSGSCTFAGTGTMTIPTTGVYFLRGIGTAYKYSGSAVYIGLSLKNAGGATVFTTSIGMAVATSNYIHLDGNAFVNLPAGTYTIVADTTDGSSCSTTTFSSIISASISAQGFTGLGGGGGGSSQWATIGSDLSYAAGGTVVGAGAINASAILQADSTTKGFLPPRMTTAQRNAIVSPATGLIVYDTTLNTLYTYNGTAWTGVGSGSDVSFWVNKGGTSQTVASNTQQLTWNTKVYDTANAFAANAFTAPVAGKYLIILQVTCSSTDCQAVINKNTSAYYYPIGGSSAASGTAVAIMNLAANDTVSAAVYTSAGATINGAAPYTSFSGMLLSGGGSGGGSSQWTTTGSDLSYSLGGAVVGASSINASAILQADSTTKGFLPPRMTTAQVNAIVSPAEGLIAYDSTTHILKIYNGTSWLTVGSGGGTIVSFAASYSGTASASAVKIVFATKQHDTASAYNSTTGEFVAPTTGYYHFSTDLGTSGNSGAVYKSLLMKTTNALGNVCTDVATDSLTHTSRACSGTLLLNSGDKVWVEFNATAGANLSGNFSGFQINAGGGGGSSQWASIGSDLSYAAGGTVVGAGAINASAILQADSTTKGFLPPRMTTVQRNAIATPATGLTVYNTTTNALETYNGTAWLSGTAATSPAFFATNSGNFTIATNSILPLTFDTKVFDTNTNYSTSTGRFTPTVPGRYIISGTIYCSDSTTYCEVYVYKNGAGVSTQFVRGSAASAHVTTLVDMNGSTDYVQLYAQNGGGTTIVGSTLSIYTNFSGTLVSGGSGGGGGSSQWTTTGSDLSYSLGGAVVGASSINASAILQADSTTKGFLPPRMTTVQRNAVVSPATGLVVYDTTLNMLYLYNGTAWTPVGGGGAAEFLLAKSATSPQAISTNARLAINTVLLSSGTNVSLNTSNNQFTLKAGNTYRLQGQSRVWLTSAGGAGVGFDYGWYNVNTGAFIGTYGSSESPARTDNVGDMALAVAYVKPVVDTILELRVTGSSASTEVIESQAWVDVLSTTVASGGGSSQWTTTGSDLYYGTGGATIGAAVAPAASAVLDLTSTTKGFLPPRMTTVQRNAIASPATGLVVYNTTTNALETYNGTAWLSGASVATVPAFSARRPSTADLVVTAASSTRVVLTAKDYDTNNNFTTGTFTPTVAGKYVIALNIGCTNSNGINVSYCQAAIYKNGVAIAQTGPQSSATNFLGAAVSAIVDMNGSTDYIDAYITTNSDRVGGASLSYTTFSGSMIPNAAGGGGGGSSQWTTVGSDLSYATGGTVVGGSAINASAILQADSTTKGFLPPRMTTVQRNAIASAATGLTIYNTTTNALETYNGTVWLSSATSTIPAFSVNKNGTSQTVTASVVTKLTWSNKLFDTNSNFASDRFTPTVAGKYIITTGAYCSDTSTGCAVYIYKNGTNVNQGYSGSNGAAVVSTAAGIIDMNGSGDYLEVYVYNSNGTTIAGGVASTYFSGALLTGATGGGGGSSQWTTVGSDLSYAAGGTVVGGSSINASAILQADSTTKGFLPPRMTTVQRTAIVTPATGLMVYDTTLNTLYNYNGTSWVSVGSGTGSSSVFTVTKPGNQTISLNTWTPITFAASASVDTNSEYASNRFTPKKPGYYWINGSANCVDNGASVCGAGIYKNGSAVNYTYVNTGGGNSVVSHNTILYMNGSSDYAEIWGYSGANGGTIGGNSYFQGYSLGGSGGGSGSSQWTTTGSDLSYSTGGAVVGASSINASAILQADSTTKGFLPPRMTSVQRNAITSPATGLIVYDTTLNALYTYTGTAWTAVGSASATPAFFTSLTSNQTLPLSNWQKVTFDTVGMNVGGNLASSRFTPTVAGKYILTSTLRFVSGSVTSAVAIYKNGVYLSYGMAPDNASSSNRSGTATVVVDANGTTDYFEVYAYSSPGGSVIYGDAAGGSTFSGALLGGGLNGGGGGSSQWTTATNDVYYNTGSVTVGGATIADPTAVLDLRSTTKGFLPPRMTSAQRIAVAAPAAGLVVYDTDIKGLYNYDGTSWIAVGASGSKVNFIVNRNGTNQTVTSGSWNKLLFTNKVVDTANAYNTSTNRFTPTVAGQYIVTAGAYCAGTADGCSVSIYKNGISLLVSKPSSIGNDIIARSAGIVDMNGSSDYLEVFAYTPGTSIGGSVSYTDFSGALLGGSGGGGGSSQWTTTGSDLSYSTGGAVVGASSINASAILQADSTTKGFLPPRMTTVQRTAIATPAAGLQVYDTTVNSLYVYNGTAWVNLGGTSVAFSVNKGGTTQTVSPNALVILSWSTKTYDTSTSFNTGTGVFTAPVAGKYLISGNIYCSDSTAGCSIFVFKNGANYQAGFSGSNVSAPFVRIDSIIDLAANDTVDLRVSTPGTQVAGNPVQTYFSGILLNGGGASGGGGSSQWTTTGSDLSYSTGGAVVGASSINASAILQADSTTKGFLPPRMTTVQRNAIASPAAGLTVYDTTANATYVYNGTAWVNTSQSQIAFTANKGGTNQTVTAATWVPLTWSTKAFDTNTNFSTATGRFTPTVAGKYFVSLNVSCQTATECNAAIYKNGTIAAQGYTENSPANFGQGVAVVIIDMNGTTDYLEGYALLLNGTVVRGGAVETNFGGFLIGGGSGSGGGSSQWTTTGSDLSYSTGGAVVGASSINASAILQADSTTKGFLPPRMTTVQRDLIASAATGLTIYNTTTNALETYNGTAWLSGAALATSPSFFVHRNGTAQNVAAVAAYNNVDWTTATYNVGSAFNLATDRFQPTVAGKYTVTFSAFCPNATLYCQISINKNGASAAVNFAYSGSQPMATVTAVIDMNGSTDYLEAAVYPSNGSVTGAIGGSATITYFTGALVGGGGGGGGGSSQWTTTGSDLSYSTGGAVVGASSINASAILQADSTTKGFLPPRMTTAQRTAIVSPAAGLTVYDTTLNTLYIYNGTAWALAGGNADVSFSVNKGGTAQTVTPGADALLAWNTKRFDPTNSFNTTTGRFTAPVAGKYILDLRVLCSSSNTTSHYCYVNIIKNGATITGSVGAANTGADAYGDASTIIDLAVGDYVEGHVTTSVTSVSGSAAVTSFSGALIGGGGAGGGGSSQWTTTGSDLSYATGGTVVGGSSINASAILQADSTTKGFLPPRMTTVQRTAIATPATGLVVYDTDLNSLYIKTATAWTAVGSSGGSSTAPAFFATKTATQSVGATAWNKITFDNVVTNINNNFASDKFQPTVAGRYIIEVTAFSSNNTTYLHPGIYKNGVLFAGNVGAVGSGGGGTGTSVSAIIDMNGTTDYLEAYAYVYTSGSATITGSPWTHFSGSLLGGGGGGSSQWATVGSDLSYASGGAIVGGGTIDASAVLQADSTTKGMLPPRMTTTQRLAISSPATGLLVYDTTLNALYVKTASAWAAVGSGAGSTAPAFWAYSNSGSNLTVTNTVFTTLPLNVASFDTTAAYNTSTYRYTPQVAGKYMFTANGQCVSSTNACAVGIFKNGVNMQYTFVPGAGSFGANASIVMDMNGSTDYVDARGYNLGGTAFSNASSVTSFSGFYIGGSAGGGGSGTPGGSTTQVQFNNAGAFGGDAGLTWDNTNKVLGLTGATASVTTPKVAMKLVTGAAAPAGGSGLWTTNGTNVWRTTGSVGVGTATPAMALDVQGNIGAKRQMVFRANNGTTNGWAVGRDYSNNDSNDFYLYDAVNAVPRLYISAAGNVGIGTVTPGFPLDVSFSSNIGTGFRITDRSPQNGNQFILFANNATTTGIISSNGTSTLTYGTTSDRRLKENIVDTAEGLETLALVRVHDFNFISDPSKTKMQGFIAQELYKVYPQAVSVGGDDVKAKPWTVDYGKITPLIIKAVQELKDMFDHFKAEVMTMFDSQNKEIKALQAENAALKAQNEAILKRLDAVEAKEK